MRHLYKTTAVALGVFDGVHLGHRAVLNAVHELYKDREKDSLCICIPDRRYDF